jgi:hypothetical protein
MRATRTVVSGILGGSVIVACAAARARPSGPAGEAAGGADRAVASSAHVVGRLRLRAEVIDLSASSLARGGAAEDLSEAYAMPVHADVASELLVRRPEQ